jgi:hypothetical protein
MIPLLGLIYRPAKSVNLSAKFVIIGVSMVMGVLFYRFPMVHDFYGEAPKLLDYLGIIPTTIPNGTHSEFFKLSLGPWAGQQRVLALVTYVAYLLQVSYKEAFYLVDAFCGFFFVLTWLLFVHRNQKSVSIKVIMGLAGITSPFLLNFFGHTEINAPVYLFNLLWMVQLVGYLQDPRSFRLWLLTLLFLICLMLHSVALLFLPVLILLWIKQHASGLHRKHNRVNWRTVSYFILIPVFIAGAILYFFVFEDYKDPRGLQFTVQEYDRLFLPLLSPDPPLDKYNLLGFNHLFDYFSVMLLWSPIAFFLLVYLLAFNRKVINWKAPEVVLTGTVMILFGSLFFVVNPLLTMQMDWDLFSFPAPVFLVFVAVAANNVLVGKPTKLLMATALSLAFLSLPAFMVHTSATSLSYRLESIGNRVYKTYYEWTTSIFEHAWSISPEDPATIEKRMDKVIDQLRPIAQPGIDIEYGSILAEKARFLMRVKKDYNASLGILTSIAYYHPDISIVDLYIMENYFMLGEMEKSYEYALRLIASEYPSERKSLRIGIHVALEAGLYDNGYQHAYDFLQKWPDDRVIREVQIRLSNNDRVGELKFLFLRNE